jgi:hypothetical protein
VLLWVFAIALTPWSSFHHHEKKEIYCHKDGQSCSHKVHVGIENHKCLVCSAHFEKDYHINKIGYSTTLKSVSAVKDHPVISASYVVLIATSLRGPPVC